MKLFVAIVAGSLLGSGLAIPISDSKFDEQRSLRTHGSVESEDSHFPASQSAFRTAPFSKDSDDENRRDEYGESRRHDGDQLSDRSRSNFVADDRERTESGQNSEHNRERSSGYESTDTKRSADSVEKNAQSGASENPPKGVIGKMQWAWKQLLPNTRANVSNVLGNVVKNTLLSWK